MAKTSIHLTACNIENSEQHNKREKILDYVRSSLSHHNESYNYTGRNLAEEVKAIRAEVKAKTGRKLQKNAVPIKEGVAVIDEHTTMADLMDFCDRCREEFGIIPLQIHIHRDEGHVKAKTWKPNLHAHIVWRMYREDGRNARFLAPECARMQTILAECLRMERGVSSDRKHLSAIQYKIEAKEQELAELNEAKAVKEAAIEGVKEKVQNFFTGEAKAKENELKGEIQRLTADLASKDAEVAKAQEKATEAIKQAKNKATIETQGMLEDVLEAKREADWAREELARANNELAKWRKFGETLWPGVLEAIKAIVERCTTAMHRFTDAGIEAIEKAIGRFGDNLRKAAADDLWKLAKGYFPEDTPKKWIEDGKEEYDNLIQGKIRQGQAMKR